MIAEACCGDSPGLRDRPVLLARCGRMRLVDHRFRSAAPLAALLALAWTVSADAAVVGSPRIDHTGKVRTGEASYETRHDAGKTTASGAPFNPRRLTAASPTLPLGTKAKVTNRDNGRSVDVTVTDRGPFVHKRILDVSPKAAAKLGLKKQGVAPVKVQPLREPEKGG